LLWHSGLEEDILSDYGVQGAVTQQLRRAEREKFYKSREGEKGQDKLGMNGLVDERFVRGGMQGGP